MRNYRRMRSGGIAAFALAAIIAISGCGSAAARDPQGLPTAQPSQQEIAALFGDWNKALVALDPQLVADHYAPEAVLLPTMSNDVRTNRAEIVDYFEHFLANKPQGQILESHVDVLGPNTAIDSGTYRFALNTNGTPSTIDARYTFVYERVNGKWLIVSHHSSAMPE
ncbi:SgcJ/EcaC family oxidoreductase [Saccharopolyspora sp. K220]|uniref:SgcJ/EcaC family oxidoreductase n=1 Tax=Saccharopolyspora soli TaxID=2926618 RepID=UPI001F55DE37|nr:SgcJ/EcaC family oxidoreductase [Saccharopolyspora soli]MCI2421702.1 SgcJ/EcaC family oxidoreductase [Saccharopolyspora soli]